MLVVLAGITPDRVDLWEGGPKSRKHVMPGVAVIALVSRLGECNYVC